MSTRADTIRQRLVEAFNPESLELVDESAKHAGHAGNKAGGGHYRVTVVSEAFAGKSTIQRHRMVYEALGDMMKREIHALSIKALTPEQGEGPDGD